MSITETVTNVAIVGAAPPEVREHCADSGLRRTLLILRIFAIAAGLLESIVFRNYVFPDDISYLEIARNYAAGHWSVAINSYWSPLLSWILAVPMKWPGVPDQWELPLLHAVLFLIYLAALFCGERLAIRIARSARVPTELLSTWYVTAYCIFLWAALWGVRVVFCAADMIVMAIVLGLALLTLSVADKRATARTYGAIGALLGAGYLAKTAMLPVAPVYLGVIAWNLRHRRERVTRLLPCLAAFVLTTAPFIVALRVHKGYWTAGEAGRLNYAWEICGAARWTHWQGEPGDIGRPLHPTRRLLSSPALYEFNSPMPVSYAPWYDPSWWYAGVRPHLIAKAEAGAILRYSAYVLVLFIAMPGVVLALAVALWKRRRLAWVPGSRELAFPALASVGLYTLVYVDHRYVAGQLAVLGLLITAAAMPLLDTDALRKAMRVLAICTMLAFTGLFLVGSAWAGLSDLIAWRAGDITRNEQYERAVELRALGLKPGDRVGCIGFSFRAYWALLDGVKIVADIPVRFPRRGGLANLDEEDYSEIDRYWRSPAATQEHVLDLMKKAGARAVIADVVPDWAQTAGWVRLRTHIRMPLGRRDVYVRFLDRGWRTGQVE